jgi:hypothetical protein
MHVDDVNSPSDQVSCMKNLFNSWGAMRNFRCVSMIVTLCLFAPGTVAGAEWKQHQFSLSGNVLMLTLPGDESDDFPSAPVVSNVDINDESNYDKWFNAIKLIEKYWDYRQFLVPGAVGTLRMTVMARAFQNPPVDTRSGSSALQAALMQRLRTKLDEMNQGLLTAGRPSIPYPLASELVTKSLNARDWIRYHTTFQDDVDVFATVIDKTHYVEIRFSFIDNSHGKKTDWRERAAADESKIMASATIQTHN